MQKPQHSSINFAVTNKTSIHTRMQKWHWFTYWQYTWDNRNCDANTGMRTTSFIVSMDGMNIYIGPSVMDWMYPRHTYCMGYTFSDPSSDRRDIASPSSWQCYENLQCYLPFVKTTRDFFPCQSLPIDHCDCVLFMYISLVWARGLKCENKIL